MNWPFMAHCQTPLQCSASYTELLLSWSREPRIFLPNYISLSKNTNFKIDPLPLEPDLESVSLSFSVCLVSTPARLSLGFLCAFWAVDIRVWWPSLGADVLLCSVVLISVSASLWGAGTPRGWARCPDSKLLEQVGEAGLVAWSFFLKFPPLSTRF